MDFKKENGITLVALIISIIILIILSYVVIYSFAKSRLIEVAINGSGNYANAQLIEKGILNDIDDTITNAVDRITEAAKPEISETEVHVALGGNTLAFYSDENSAREFAKNGGSYYGEISDRVFERVGTNWLDKHINTPWYEDRAKIKNVSFNTKIAPKNMKGYFEGLTELKSIEKMENLKTKNVTSMEFMFSNCSKLESVDLSKLNTENVISMDAMFNKCESLKSVDLSSFNTSNLTNMNSMFCICTNLEEINFENFDTSKVTDMGYMFQNCSKLKKLDLSSFDTSKVTDMRYMFVNCSNLTEINIATFDMSGLINSSYTQSMFDGISSNVQIKTNNTMKEWLKTNYPNFANVNI